MDRQIAEGLKSGDTIIYDKEGSLFYIRSAQGGRIFFSGGDNKKIIDLSDKAMFFKIAQLLASLFGLEAELIEDNESKMKALLKK